MNPIINQVWAWTYNGELREIVLITRYKAKMFYGFLIYHRFDDLVGTEVCADYIENFHTKYGWTQLT